VGGKEGPQPSLFHRTASFEPLRSGHRQFQAAPNHRPALAAFDTRSSNCPAVLSAAMQLSTRFLIETLIPLLNCNTEFTAMFKPCSDVPELASVSPSAECPPSAGRLSAGRLSAGRFRFAHRIGLTLIELVIVMVILATLAALIIPRLGFIQSQAVSVSGAAGAEGLMNNLETYRATTGFYPQGFDSLLASGGTTLITQLIQGPSAGGNPTPPIMPFTAGSINTDPMAAASFGMTFGPATAGTTGYRIFDQDATTTGEDISSSFNTQREMYSTGGVAIVPQTATGQAIWQAAFPGTVTSAGAGTYPAGVTLIALGVGPQCNAVGSTMAGAPLQTGQQPGYYARYIAIFALYGTGYGPNGSYAGKGAELKLVLDSNYNTIGTNIGLYKQAAPVDQ
jgi:type II secretory pathway pseudopilin PulG